MKNALTLDWINLSNDNGLQFIRVADYALAKSLRLTHLRSGKIPAGASKEGKGIEVLAYGFDELGNVCALLKNGQTRQFTA
jgi:hypothetical protein